MKALLFFACFVLILCTALGTVSAYQRLCLTDGQSVPSSDNPRYTCTHDSCQICVDDNLYPTSLSRCNDLECEPFYESDIDDENDDSSSDDDNDESDNDGGPEDGVINVDTHTDDDDSSSNSDTNSNSNTNSDSSISVSSQSGNSIVVNEPSETPEGYEPNRKTGNIISEIIPDISDENKAVSTSRASSSSFNKLLFFISTGFTILLIIILVALLLVNNYRIQSSYEEIKPTAKRRKLL